MKKNKAVPFGSTLVLKLTIGGMGAVVAGLCIGVLPIGIITDTTGYYWPILLGMYITAIPFFYALYQAFKLLKLIDKNMAFTELSVVGLRRIKGSAATISALYALGLPYIFYVADKDDAPGVLKLALVVVFASFVIAVASAVFERLFQNAVDIKAENDLTV